MGSVVVFYPSYTLSFALFWWFLVNFCHCAFLVDVLLLSLVTLYLWFIHLFTHVFCLFWGFFALFWWFLCAIYVNLHLLFCIFVCGSLWCCLWHWILFIFSKYWAWLYVFHLGDGGGHVVSTTWVFFASRLWNSAIRASKSSCRQKRLNGEEIKNAFMCSPHIKDNLIQ